MAFSRTLHSGHTLSRSVLTRIGQACVLGVSLAVLSGSPQLAHAQRVINPSPAQQATDVEPTSPISATFQSATGVEVRPETVEVFLDGENVTSQSVITKDFFSYRPASPLSPGDHRVILSFTNTRGVTRRVSWTFTVSTPVNATIDSVVHNAGNRALAAGEILLVTVNGTSDSKVTVYLIQDGQKVQTFTAQEVSSGVYVVSRAVQAADSTAEGIIVARLENTNQIRFATAEQPLQLIQGARETQSLTIQDVDAVITGPGESGTLQPQVTNYSNGDSVAGSSFTLEGKTLPGATVEVSTVAQTSPGDVGLFAIQQTLASRSVQADSQGNFSVSVQIPITATAEGTVYNIELVAKANGSTSPTTKLQLVRDN